MQQKDKIDITDMTLSKRQYKDKEYVKVKIFGFTAEAEQTEYAEDYADFDQPISDIPFSEEGKGINMQDEIRIPVSEVPEIGEIILDKNALYALEL